MVTGPVTVVSVERSPTRPTATVLDPTPAVESVRVSKTVVPGLPRQSYEIVIGVAEGSMLVAAGGKLYCRLVPSGRVTVREVTTPVLAKSIFTV